MTRRSAKHGRSTIARHLLAAGLTLTLGYAFGVFTLGGCGGSQTGSDLPADGQLPERVVEALTDCARRRGPTALQRVEHTISYDVFMDPDSQVLNVALRRSTLHLDELEACMDSALQAVSERAVDASLRRREPDSPAPLPPESRTLVAAGPIALPAGVAQALIVVGFMAITVVVYFQVLRNTKTHRPPPPTVVEDPPKPEPPKPAPQITDPPPAPPRPPQPPPPPPREVCSEIHPGFIRCDDPRIRGYNVASENAAFNEIVKKLRKGMRKEQTKKKAIDGPCVNRGGFHTKVKRGEDYVASIVGCDCCDDSTGKAVAKEKATVIYKP